MHGETEVLHYLEVLRDKIGWDAVKAAVKKPLTGRKIGAYYGCLLLRPSREMGFDDPENPTILEDFIRALGAEPVYYALRNECCGGYTTLENRGFAAKQAQKIADNAKHAGAEVLITACPLCMYNLSQNTDGSVPVRLFHRSFWLKRSARRRRNMETESVRHHFAHLRREPEKMHALRQVYGIVPRI